VPSGFHAVDPASGSRTVVVVAEATVRADFAIAADDVTPPPPPPPTYVNVPETWNYWSREARAAQRGHGGHSETFKDMRDTYPTRIFEQFAQHATDPVRVQGVTQIDPDGPFFHIPLDIQRAVWPTEDFELVESHVETILPEDDLFAGIRGTPAAES